MTSRTIPNHQLKRFEYLSTYLRELRINEGLTQSELCSLNRNTISRAENARNVTLLSIFELADAYDISLKDLFGDID